jgi:hypothetical protein
MHAWKANIHATFQSIGLDRAVDIGFQADAERDFLLVPFFAIDAGDLLWST